MKLRVSSTLQNALVHFSFLLYNVFANICAGRLHSLLFPAEVTCPRLLLAAGLECVLLCVGMCAPLWLLTPQAAPSHAFCRCTVALELELVFGEPEEVEPSAVLL